MEWLWQTLMEELFARPYPGWPILVALVGTAVMVAGNVWMHYDKGWHPFAVWLAGAALDVIAIVIMWRETRG